MSDPWAEARAEWAKVGDAWRRLGRSWRQVRLALRELLAVEITIRALRWEVRGRQMLRKVHDERETAR